MIHYDRTRATLKWRCRRRRFWSFDFKNRGISPKRRALALEFGSILHEGLGDLLLGEELPSVVMKALGTLNEQLADDGIEEMVNATHQRVMEIRFLTEGLLRVADRVILPKIREFYRPVRVEGETLYEHDGCVLMSKPDALLERVADEALVYLEFKSSSGLDERWQKQWFRAVQLPSAALAIAQTLGKPLAATIVVGLNKGYWSRQYERQESPLLYGYRDGDRVVAKYRNGLRKVAVWDVGITSEQWIEQLDAETLEKQVVSVGPIPFQEHMTRSWLRQTAAQEKVFAEAREQLFGGAPLREVEARAILDRVWDQNFDECQSGWGSDCPYLDACFVPHIERDPIGSGLFEWRTPHHSTEVLEEVA